MNISIFQKEILNFLINIDKIVLYMFQNSAKSQKGYTKLFETLQNTTRKIEKIYYRYFLTPGLTTIN